MTWTPKEDIYFCVIDYHNTNVLVNRLSQNIKYARINQKFNSKTSSKAL